PIPPHPYTLLLFPFFFTYSPHHRALHSFPTRRSSDLETWRSTTRTTFILSTRTSLTTRSRAGASTAVGLPTCSSTSRGRSFRQRSEEHTSELQSPYDLVCRLLLEKKKKKTKITITQSH